MNTAARRFRLWGTFAVLLSLAGCATWSHTAQKEAARRWSVARAQVKTRLASDQFEAGNVTAAAKEIAEADRLAPNDPEHIPLRVRIWLAEGKLTQAAELLEQARLDYLRAELGQLKPGQAEAEPSRPHPGQAEIEYLLGVVRQQQQRSDEALAAYTRAAEIDNTEVSYVVAVVQTLLQLGRSRDALDVLVESAPRFEWTGAYQAALAECHEQLGDWPAAMAAWQRLASAGGPQTETRARLAQAAYRAGRYTDAIPALLELLDDAENGSPTLTRLALAECYLATGQTAAARQQAQAILQRERNNVRALRILARALAADGDYVPALHIAQQALAVDGHDAHTLELTAALAWRAADHKLAASTATRLAALDAQNPVAQRILNQSR